MASASWLGSITMKQFLFVALCAWWFTWPSVVRAADLIPADRLADWTPGVTVGVPGGIPTDRTHLIDVTQVPYQRRQDWGGRCTASDPESDRGRQREGGGLSARGHVPHRQTPQDRLQEAASPCGARAWGKRCSCRTQGATRRSTSEAVLQGRTGGIRTGRN